MILNVYGRKFIIAGSDKYLNNIHPNLDSNEFNTFFAIVGTKISDTFKQDPLK